jgi:hypothetical protein
MAREPWPQQYDQSQTEQQRGKRRGPYTQDSSTDLLDHRHDAFPSESTITFRPRRYSLCACARSAFATQSCESLCWLVLNVQAAGDVKD